MTVRILALTIIIALVACQKEDPLASEEQTTITKSRTKLDLGFEIKRKTLVAKEWTKQARLKPRYGHTSFVYDNKMWIIGGMVDGMPKSDVLYSEDGINWCTATPNAPFSGRTGHASAVFQGKMWVMGGKKYDPNDHDEDIDPGNQTHVDGDDHSLFDEYSELNDIWWSTDGKTWELASTYVSCWPRYDHTLTAFNGSLYITGGVSRDDQDASIDGFQDVVKSDNGYDWKRVHYNDSFIGRTSPAAIVAGEHIIIIGGYDHLGSRRIQFSNDGENWSYTDPDPVFSRYHHSLSYDGESLWLIAGRNLSTLSNDLWYSKNGLQWFTAGVTKSFPGRKEHTSVFFKNKLWVINGLGEPSKGQVDGIPLSDIWSFEEADSDTIDDITLSAD